MLAFLLIKAHSSVVANDQRLSMFSTWLVTIATNAALTQLRKKRRRPEVLFSGYADAFSDALGALPDDSVDVEARFVLQERTELLRAAVERLVLRSGLSSSSGTSTSVRSSRSLN